ncbi:MAG: 2,3-bisphosphoglycerate-independent phosphoglycerate mutase [Clostridia bacterium]|nr:2,3-bisphosphoglycerate-independent phosphoglycerate mutase [Clostridia bacterium]
MSQILPTRAEKAAFEKQKKPLVFMILDGWGIAPKTCANAILTGKTCNMCSLMQNYPTTQLMASGESVGLPEGQMGNSEVGHSNIGAGRVVYQDLTRINKAIKDRSFFDNKVLVDAVKHGKTVHLMGLLSEGGVHSHLNHLFALLEMCAMHGARTRVHCFLDGRDVQPGTAPGYIRQLQEKIDTLGGDIAIGSVSGRYYAMDRDKRWERVLLAYRTLTGQNAYIPSAPAPEAIKFNSNPADEVQASCDAGETDEFVRPFSVTGDYITSEDSVIFFNYRPDRAREITATLVDDNFDGFVREKAIKPRYVCMTQYDANMPNVEIAFPPQDLSNVFGEYISKKGLTQLRLAETEKYAHVTFFFNGGREAPFEGEERKLVASPKVPTYDTVPAMSAPEVKKEAEAAIKSGAFDIIILNFANCDMVGHTGNFDAARIASEVVDTLVGELVELTHSLGGTAVITADHGNAEKMLDENGDPFTAHTCAPVPFIVTDRKIALRDSGALCDIAPTLLDLLGLEKPAEMSGESLIDHNVDPFKNKIEGDSASI